ncbi:MAG: hypothetical protein ACFHWX_13880 [Bacteroidota bacterium]
MITKKLIANTLLTGVFSFLLTLPLFAQESKYSDIEEIQDEIEDLYMKAYNIFENNPNVTYEYVYDGDDLQAVEITGVVGEQDKKRLEVYLMDIADLENKILNQANRVGIFYVTETDPHPKEGLEKFYHELQTQLKYPEEGFKNLEGTLYAKFVVDDEGNINNVVFSSDFKGKDRNDIQVQEMKMETKKAIEASSGHWVPAKIDGIPVAEWVVLPVKFKIDNSNNPMMW